MAKSSSYFETDTKNKVIRFTGDTLTMWINVRWQAHGGLTINGNEVTAIAIGDMLINDSIETSILCAGFTQFYPTDFSFVRKDEDEFIELHFVKGDAFMGTQVVKDAKLAYAVFYELLYIGAMPKTLKYNNVFDLFDRVATITGISFPVDHAIWELLYATVYRDKNNLSTPARLAGAKAELVHIPLRDVTHLANSTSAKLIGSYFGDAIDSALIHPAEESNLLEDILRQ